MSPRAPAREGPAACLRRRESTRASRQGRNLDRPKIGQDRLPRDGSGFLLKLKATPGRDRHPNFEHYRRWRCHRALDMDSPALRPRARTPAWPRGGSRRGWRPLSKARGAPRERSARSDHPSLRDSLARTTRPRWPSRPPFPLFSLPDPKQNAVTRPSTSMPRADAPGVLGTTAGDGIGLPPTMARRRCRSPSSTCRGTPT